MRLVEQLHIKASGIHPEVHWNSGLWIEGGDPPPLLSPGEATSGVPCPVVGSPVQEGQRTTGEGPAKGHKDGQGIDVSLLGETESWAHLVWIRLRGDVIPAYK